MAVDLSLERKLPQNLEAERSVLGAILIDNHAFHATIELLDAGDFFLDSHRRLFTRMIALSEENRAIDLITLHEELERAGELEAAGGSAYLSSLVDGVPRVSNVEHYARIVKQKSILRSLINASNDIINQALEGQEEADEVLDRAEGAIFGLAEERIKVGLVPVKEIARTLDLDELFERRQHITGLETSFTDFDNLTSGLQPAELIIIAARPGMGKTAISLNIAQHAATLGKPVAVFSLEMAREALLHRMLCSEARVDSHRFRSGYLNREEMRRLTQALGRLASAPLYIDDTPGLNVLEVRAKCRRLEGEQKGLALIVVDYLQLMSGRGRFENRTQEISSISRGLKALAKEMRVPVIAVSQLSRAPEQRGGDHRPQLSDLRESGSIEQDADVVAFIFRPEVYRDPDTVSEDERGRAELIIAKQRNGPTGKVNLAFLREFTRFENLLRQPPMEGEEEN